MQHPTAGESLRVAIALAALRYKPLDQSYDAYMLDLFAKFPCPDAAALNDDPWRKRALELEQTLQELQAKYDSERIELLSLRDTKALQAPEDSSGPPGSKKKQKKKAPPVKIPPRTDLRSILNGLDTGSGLPHIPSTNHVLAVLETLDQLISARITRKSALSDELFIAVTTRALDALGRLLSFILPPNTPLSSSPDNLDTLATLISRLLTAVLPLLIKLDRKKTKPHGRLTTADILARMTALLLVPLVRSLVPLSELYLTALFSPQKPGHAGRSQAHAIDIRPNVLALLSSTLSVMDGLMLQTAAFAACALDTRHLLALEAVRALHKLLPRAEPALDGLGSGEQAASAHRPERVQRLIRKDAVWFLCSALHLTLPTGGFVTEEERISLLEEAIYTTTSAVLRSARACGQAAFAPDGRADPAPRTGSAPARGCARDEMEEVERGMILAVAERLLLRS